MFQLSQHNIFDLEKRIQFLLCSWRDSNSGHGHAIITSIPLNHTTSPYSLSPGLRKMFSSRDMQSCSLHMTEVQMNGVHLIITINYDSSMTYDR